MYTVYHITTLSQLHVFGVTTNMEERMATIIKSPPALFMVSGGDVDTIRVVKCFTNLDHAVREERRLVAEYAGWFGVHMVRSMTLEIDNVHLSARDVEEIEELMFIMDVKKTVRAKLKDSWTSVRSATRLAMRRAALW